MKITVPVKAWISDQSALTPDEIATPEGAAKLIYTNSNFSNLGFTLVATADVTIEIPDRDSLIASKVAALREQAANLRAETSAKCTAIEGQIQSLLAIDHTPPEAM